MRQRIFLAALFLALMLPFSGAFGLTVEDAGVDIGCHSVHYPILRDEEPSEIPDSLNASLLEKGDYSALVARLPAVMSSSVPLLATYRCTLTEDLFSCLMEQSGPLTTLRPDHRFRSFTSDLRSGREIHLEDFFDPESDWESFLLSLLKDEIAPELSAHLLNQDLESLPESFFVDRYGLTLLYDMTKLSTLSDRAGSVELHWNELQTVLDPDEDGLPARLGVREEMEGGKEALEGLRLALGEGRLPGLPVRLGDSMTTVIQTYRLLSDPDNTAQARLFYLEDARFRGVSVMTDTLHERSYDQSIVLGIRSDRFMASGLITGESTRDRWLAMLGEPDSTHVLGPERAEALRLCEGTSDTYILESCCLCLHSDTAGVLRSVILTGQDK